MQRPFDFQTVLLRQIVKHKLSLVNREAIEGKHSAQEYFSNLVAARNQRVGYISLSLWIGVLRDFYDSPYLVIGEGRDLFGGPKLVIGQTIQERPSAGRDVDPLA